MKKISLIVFMALLFFSGNISSLRAQPCYVYDTIPFAPDSLSSGAITPISPLLPIGFGFCFFGNTYSQCVLSENGIISFNLSDTSGFSPWSIPVTPLPTPTVPTNCIMIPWQDLFLSSGGTIKYQLLGTAPFRRFVVAFTNVPFYSTGLCPGDYYNGQAILYETLNSIEIHILNNSVCTALNNGRAIIAVQNSTGTDATSAYPSAAYPWTQTFTNQAFRFYSVCSCPYSVDELNGAENFQLKVFPNPSENNFNVSYELKEASKVTAGIYNALGELITSLADDEKQTSGKHNYNLNLSDAGIYFLKLGIGNEVVSRKFVVTN
jgi:hypothetical protein